MRIGVNESEALDLTVVLANGGFHILSKRGHILPISFNPLCVLCKLNIASYSPPLLAVLSTFRFFDFGAHSITGRAWVEGAITSKEADVSRMAPEMDILPLMTDILYSP